MVAKSASVIVENLTFGRSFKILLKFWVNFGNVRQLEWRSAKVGAVLVTSTDIIDYCWEILQDYVWEAPITPLTSEDFRLFKRFGWPCGLS